ncbi:17033_t:CDS:2 [Racocetra fulgida]|uniref:17033_t:CDS:1 n=1 Tax=Racocetra fulgida TaxID=60492 RepID=A0A9N9AI68_9GLOM|nr:17033_t:CDS:2 [Racocetra fulgida]
MYQNSFSKIDIKGAIDKDKKRISQIIENEDKKRKSEIIENKENNNVELIFKVIQEEIETILLNELIYMPFQQKIKEYIRNKIQELELIPDKMSKKYNKKKISEKISNEMSKEISDIFKSEIKNILEKITTETLEKSKANQFDTKMTQSDIIESSDSNMTQPKIITESLDKINIIENALNNPKNNVSGKLTDIFMKCVNEVAASNEEVNTTALLMYILFIIADSDSLIILDDMTENFLTKKQLRLALIRTSIDIFIKSIPLITIMVC